MAMQQAVSQPPSSSLGLCFSWEAKLSWSAKVCNYIITSQLLCILSKGKGTEGSASSWNKFPEKRGSVIVWLPACCITMISRLFLNLKAGSGVLEGVGLWEGSGWREGRKEGGRREGCGARSWYMVDLDLDPRIGRSIASPLLSLQTKVTSKGGLYLRRPR